MSETPEAPQQAPDRHCYRHPDRRGGVTCQRCDRLLCTECMHQASVGFHCPECIARQPSPPSAPMGSQSSGGSRPKATRALLGLNLAAFVYSVAVGGSARAITSLPTRVMADGALFARLWERRGGEVVWLGVAEGDYHRLVTSAFLHDGPFHLGMNMYALWLLGQWLEDGFGRARFLWLYAVSMLGGSLGVLLLSPDSPTVGASGAVFGLMGALVAVQRAIGANFLRSGLAMVLVLNLVFTLAIPRVSVGAHFGGLITGAAMGAAMLALQRRNAPGWATSALGVLAATALVAGSVLAATR